MMVGQMGFSKKLGQVAWSSSGGNSFMGSQMAQPADCSGETQDAIDAEVKVRGAGACVGLGGVSIGELRGEGWRGPGTGICMGATSAAPCSPCSPFPAAVPPYLPVYRRTALQDIVDRAYRRAKDLVLQNISVLHACSELLLEREQIDGEDLQALLVEAQSEQYLKPDEPSISIPYRTA